MKIPQYKISETQSKYNGKADINNESKIIQTTGRWGQLNLVEIGQVDEYSTDL